MVQGKGATTFEGTSISGSVVVVAMGQAPRGNKISKISGKRGLGGNQIALHVVKSIDSRTIYSKVCLGLAWQRKKARKLFRSISPVHHSVGRF